MSAFKAGFVGIIGEPNAGKSTLMNTLIQEKVSIVTPKPQTTRQRITGILSAPDAQLVFVDAPGYVAADGGLNKFLHEEFADVIAKSDVLLVLLPADGIEAQAERLVKVAQESGKPFAVLISKADLLKGTQTPRFFQMLLENKIAWVSVSALNRPEEARGEVINLVKEFLPESPAPLYDPELYTTQTMREMAAEMIREKCFEHLHQEVPYGMAVVVREFKENSGAVVKIAADLMVDKENHKSIVIGAKGAGIKRIGMEARKEIEKLVGRQVFLELHVVVKPQWARNKRMMEELGYVIRES